MIAALAEPLNVHPSVLTLGNLALGVAGSALVVLGDGAKAISITGLVGIILWQLAYALDCADGQLARATGRASSSGARLDTFVDLAVQTSVLVAIASVVEHWSHPPTALVVILVGTWYVNFIGYLHDRIDAKAVPSLLPSRAALVSVVKLGRDYGFVALVLGVWLAFAPTTLLIPVLGITAVNVATLAGYIAQATLISIRSPAEAQNAGTGRARMKAIILAAGYARRMRPLSIDRHKTLLEVGGRSIIARIVDGLIVNDIADICVVTGYRADEVTSYLKQRYASVRFTFVNNENFATTNNIYSMALALEEFTPDDDILLIELDLIFEPDVLGRILRSAHPNVALVDRHRIGMDGTVVTVASSGVITQVIPSSLQDERFRLL